MSAALTLPLAADCFSSMAMFLLFRSDNELISGRARTSATRLSELPVDPDAVSPASLGSAGSISGFCDTPAGSRFTVIAVTRSAIPVASTTCCRIVRGAKAGAAAAAAGNAAISDVAGGAAISSVAGGGRVTADFISGFTSDLTSDLEASAGCDAAMEAACAGSGLSELGSLRSGA